MTLKDFHDYIKHPVAADGAWGTELLKSGLVQGDAPESWNLESPEKITKIAASYARAGSRIILTNTFGGNSFKLEHQGLENKMAVINTEGARLTRGSVREDLLSQPVIWVQPGVWSSWVISAKKRLKNPISYKEKLSKKGARIYCFWKPSQILLRSSAALKGAVRTGLPVVCTLTYDRMADGSYRTVMGHAPEDVHSSSGGSWCGGPGSQLRSRH